MRKRLCTNIPARDFIKVLTYFCHIYNKPNDYKRISDWFKDCWFEDDSPENEIFEDARFYELYISYNNIECSRYTSYKFAKIYQEFTYEKIMQENDVNAIYEAVKLGLF
jgi:hypothetical protein